MKIVFDKTEHTKWFVNESGEVFSATNYHGNGAIRRVAPNKNKRGYLYIRTSNGNYQIHRLVAAAFIDNKENKPCVNHINGDKHDNRSTNLEWVTHKENTAHAIKSGLMSQLKKNQGNVKYSNAECKKVLERLIKGMTYREAGEVCGMPYSTVAHLVRGSRREIS